MGYDPGCVRAVRDEGMPQETNPSVRGNLYIIINVVFPAELDDQSIARLKQAFPENKRSPKPGNDLEDVTLRQVDIKAERKRWKLEKQDNMTRMTKLLEGKLLNAMLNNNW